MSHAVGQQGSGSPGQLLPRPAGQPPPPHLEVRTLPVFTQVHRGAKKEGMPGRREAVKGGLRAARVSSHRETQRLSQHIPAKGKRIGALASPHLPLVVEGPPSEGCSFRYKGLKQPERGSKQVRMWVTGTRGPGWSTASTCPNPTTSAPLAPSHRGCRNAGSSALALVPVG